MNTEKIIKKALAEIAIAQSLSQQASERFYKASKSLESINSPASRKRANKGLSEAQVASVIGKRNLNIKRKSA